MWNDGCYARCACLCLPEFLQVAGMFSGTPVALTALPDTHILQLATLPQVLGILAFVYAGMHTTCFQLPSAVGTHSSVQWCVM
jgi:DMSO/TMAO reductase YedYZ heme-binding membrane subunit